MLREVLAADRGVVASPGGYRHRDLKIAPTVGGSTLATAWWERSLLREGGGGKSLKWL